ncbi:MAG: putative metal-binding motif-containing protein, partial [Myxococcales bacterium]|nr:putative metal-binding motif-containing protein [Myxococcales bacterium]
PNNFPGNLEICGDGQDNDCDGSSDPNTCMGLGTYVSQLDGDDISGDGTQQNPVATIAKGMANAVMIGNSQPVFVAEGDYNEKVNLIEDIDLLGGYHCAPNDCTWDNDPQTYLSQISATDNEGVRAGDGITRITMVTGFTIAGRTGFNPGNGNTVAGMTVAQGTPSLVNNVFVGGNIMGCNQCSTHGLLILGTQNDPAGVLVDGNRIIAGNSPATSAAVTLRTFQNPAIAEITNNWIKGGSGQYTRAVSAFASAPGTQIRNNEIFAGNQTGNNNGSTFAIIISGEVIVDGNRINHDPNEVGSCPSPNANAWCGGLESQGATAIITNNLIFGVPGVRSTGIWIAEGEVPFGDLEINGNTIEGGGTGGQISAGLVCRTSQGINAKIGDVRNNIIRGGNGQNSWGFYEDNQTVPKNCEPNNYNNNAIYDVDNAHRHWTAMGTAVTYATAADVNSMAAYASGNISTDCSLDNTGHIPGNSACVDAGVMTEAPATDIDGDVRPQGAGIDIGCDEAQ